MCYSWFTYYNCRIARWALSSTFAGNSDTNSFLTQFRGFNTTNIDTVICSLTLKLSPSSSLFHSLLVVSSASPVNSIFILHHFLAKVFLFFIFHSALLHLVYPDQVCVFSYWEFVVSLFFLLMLVSQLIFLVKWLVMMIWEMVLHLVKLLQFHVDYHLHETFV